LRPPRGHRRAESAPTTDPDGPHLIEQLGAVEAWPATHVEDALAGCGAERLPHDPASAHCIADAVHRLDLHRRLLVGWLIDPPFVAFDFALSRLA
jgi:hypothetical protein